MRRGVKRGARHHALDRAGRVGERAEAPATRGSMLQRLHGLRARRAVRRARLDRDDRPPRARPRRRARARRSSSTASYFKQLRAAGSKPGACFGFQAILRNRVPRNRKDLEDLQVHRRRDLPGRPQPAPRGADHRGQPVLGDRRAAHAAQRLRQDHRRVAAPPPAERERRSARSGATRSSTTTTATSSTCVRAFDEPLVERRADEAPSLLTRPGHSRIGVSAPGATSQTW